MAKNLIIDPHCSFLLKFSNRQEDQDKPFTCPVDREGLDRDRVNNFVFQKFSAHITKD